MIPPTSATQTTTTASCYYCANLTLELLLNAGNGFVYALISYYMLDYQAYVQAPDPTLSAFGFVGLVTLTNVISNVSESRSEGRKERKAGGGLCVRKGRKG